MDSDSQGFEVNVFENGLPAIMPGEVVLPTSTHSAAYDPWGKLITEDPFEGARVMADWEKRKDHHFLTSLDHRGKHFEVSTVWLALNHNWWGGPPLIWETMAQSDDWLNFQTRYCTRGAALNGHLTIIAVLLRGGMQLVETNVDIPGHQVHTTHSLEDGDV